MNKTLHQIKNIATFAALIALAYLQDAGRTWSHNILMFLTAISFIGYAVISFSAKPDNDLLESYRKGEHLPKPVDATFYMAFCCVLAAGAHWFMAIGWLIVAGADFLLRAKSKGGAS